MLVQILFLYMKGSSVIKHLSLSTLIVVSFASLLASQPKFTAADYKRALWMTTRFYGAQRSGEGPNWLIMQHDTTKYRTSFTKDADGTRDLSGGWFDCGDHVTFGQTFFYSAYMLAKAYDLFPLGFHDLYRGLDYADYVASGSWDMDGGSPNGIPDLLEELKYATDWIIKATPDGSTFYWQKGEGDKDHKLWVTAGKMSAQPAEEGGEPRKMFKNPDDGVMPAFAAAALAVMSRVFKKYDEEYAAECLAHAKNAFSYAKMKKGMSTGAGGYYGSCKAPLLPYVVAASEMYAATKDESYKSEAAANQDKVEFHNYGMDYSNSHDLAPLALATTGINVAKLEQLKTMFINQYTQSLNSEGVCTRGNSGWGALRYPGNHAFVAAAWSQVKVDTSLMQFILKQVDYIMGSNSAKQSFIVGFCSGCSRQVRLPHHRNVYLRDDNPDDAAKSQMTIPARNAQFGYMVGGTMTSSSYKESVTDYAMTEGGIDYNAGLVGALGYIVSRLAPADTSRMVGIADGKRIDMRSHSALRVQHTGNGWRLASGTAIPIVRVMIADLHGRRVRTLNPNAAEVFVGRESLGRGVFTVTAYLGNGSKTVCNLCVVQ
jgi:hypothetical protein